MLISIIENFFWKLLGIRKAFADDPVTTGGGNVNLPNPLGTNNLVNVVGNITGWLITVATPIVAVMVLLNFDDSKNFL